MVLPAQQVEVLELGATTSGGVGVDELLDVVGFGGPGDRSCAAGDRTGRAAQAEMLEHGLRRRIAVRGQRQEGSRARIGEDPVPDALAAGDLPRDRGRERDRALQHAGGVGEAQQGEHRHGDVQAEARRGHAHAVGVELGVQHQVVAEPVERHGALGRARDAVEVIGDLGPLPQGVALCGLDRVSGLVQALPEREDLGDRPAQRRRSGPGAPVGGELDLPRQSLRRS